MAFIIGLLKKWQKKEIKRTFYHYGENPEYFIEHKPPPIVLYPKATYFGTFLIFDNKKILNANT